MSTCSKLGIPALALALLAWPAAAQDQQNLTIDFPSESPVSVVSMDWGSSKTDARGGAMVVDLHTSLKLRNSTQQRIRGITLLVLAQEVTPGGKASVSVPSLNIGPGEVFPVRLDLRLLRPLQRGTGPLVKVDLDGILFEDLSFFGPNRLNSRRSMMVWEMQARRDREHFKRVLEARGAEGLQQEVLASVARQAERPRLGVRVARRGRSTNVEGGEQYRLAFLGFPDAPVEAVSGVAEVVGQEARTPQLELRNLSKRPVRHLELGWIIKDMQGQQYVAGTIPADVNLAPGATGKASSERVLRFNKPMMVESMSGFVNHVEFDDGEVWIPSREALHGNRLDRLMAPSPEEQRLTNLYRKKGMKALVEELDKF
jgi:hypothetical protein